MNKKASQNTHHEDLGDQPWSWGTLCLAYLKVFLVLSHTLQQTQYVGSTKHSGPGWEPVI